MSTNETILFPESLVLPTRNVTSQLTTAKAGEICLSGAKLTFFDGSAWRLITSV